eukprot:m.70136 g.70136  ORF g.70136 m.70136 type:complete len:354 (+) comp12110_c0_seq1:160-1221(+)
MMATRKLIKGNLKEVSGQRQCWIDVLYEDTSHLAGGEKVPRSIQYIVLDGTDVLRAKKSQSVLKKEIEELISNEVQHAEDHVLAAYTGKRDEKYETAVDLTHGEGELRWYMHDGYGQKTKLGSCQLKKDKGGSQDGSVFLDVFQHYFNQVEKERQRNDILQQDVDRLRANRQEIIDMHDKQKMDERASFKEMIVAMCFNLNEKKREIRELSGLPPSEPPEIVFKESNTPSERVNKRIKVSSTEPGPDENDNASDLESISGEDESEAESEHEKVQAFDEILTQEDESIFDQPTQDAYEAETQVMDGHPDDYEEETQVQGTQPTQVLAEPETMAVSTMVGTSGTQLLPETESLDL